MLPTTNKQHLWQLPWRATLCSPAFRLQSVDIIMDLVCTAGRQPVLTFEPSSGTVPAGGQLALAVTFAPSLATSTNFNVTCPVKRKPTKLTLNVKGEGYAVHDSLQMDGADGRLVELSPDAPNTLDCGQVGFCFQRPQRPAWQHPRPFADAACCAESRPQAANVGSREPLAGVLATVQSRRACNASQTCSLKKSM